MVLPYIDMNSPWVNMCFPSWAPLPPPSLSHPSESSQYTSPEHPVSCIEPGLAICFTYDNLHVSMSFSHIILLLPSPTESKRLFYTSVSLLLSHIQGYHYHLSWKFWQKRIVWLYMNICGSISFILNECNYNLFLPINLFFQMAPHSSILAWKIPWAEEPGRLQSVELQSQTQLNDWVFNIAFKFLLCLMVKLWTVREDYF